MAAAKPKGPRNTAGTRAAAGGKVAGLPVWAWFAIGAGLVGFYLWHRSRSSSSSGIVDRPAVGSAGAGDSAAQQPSGGGGSAAGNLPDSLISPGNDPLTTQVQQTDTSSGSSPQMLNPDPGSQFVVPPASSFGPTGPSTYVVPPASSFGGGGGTYVPIPPGLAGGGSSVTAPAPGSQPTPGKGAVIG